MISGIGIDSVDIARFEQWHTYSLEQLHRFFSTAEIAYCLQDSAHSASRFAVRFAAREALFKALSSAGYMGTLFQLARTVSIEHTAQGAPYFRIDTHTLGMENMRIALSMTHTDHVATAFVIAHKEHHE
jgi:phosphopantetheine--protein transferase-like protein